jgi:hypothetical protein
MGMPVDISQDDCVPHCPHKNPDFHRILVKKGVIFGKKNVPKVRMPSKKRGIRSSTMSNLFSYKLHK